MKTKTSAIDEMRFCLLRQIEAFHANNMEEYERFEEIILELEKKI